jgi:hypothetical protein
MKRLPVVCAVLLVAIVAASSRPGWGRLRQYGTKTFDVVVPAIPDGAMIILADKPLGFVAPFLRGHDSNYVGIVDLPGLGRLNIEIQRRIRHATQALVLIDRPPESYAARLRSFGRQIDPATCHRIDNSFDRNLVLCATQAADRP